jgi:hypothetical protein
VKKQLDSLRLKYEALEQLRVHFERNDLSNCELIAKEFLRKTTGITGAILASLAYSPDGVLLLARTLFESAVVFRILDERRRRGAEEAAKEFFIAGLIQRVKQWKELEEHGLLGNEQDYSIEDFERMLEQVPMDKKKAFAKYGYLQQSLWQVCKDLGLGHEYAMLYRSASHHAHGADITWSLAADKDIVQDQMTHMVEIALNNADGSIRAISGICIDMLRERDDAGDKGRISTLGRPSSAT